MGASGHINSTTGRADPIGLARPLAFPTISKHRSVSGPEVMPLKLMTPVTPKLASFYTRGCTESNLTASKESRRLSIIAGCGVFFLGEVRRIAYPPCSQFGILVLHAQGRIIWNHLRNQAAMCWIESRHCRLRCGPPPSTASSRTRRSNDFAGNWEDFVCRLWLPPKLRRRV